MPRLRFVVTACVVVMAGAIGMSLWMSAWPRLHDQATEAAVAARDQAVPKRTPAAKRKTRPRPKPQEANLAAAIKPVRATATPVPILAPSPPYPMDALLGKHEGVVILRVGVDAAGSVDSVDVVHSSGHPKLDASARKTMHEWRFEPPAGHQPMAFDYPVRFQIAKQ